MAQLRKTVLVPSLVLLFLFSTSVVSSFAAGPSLSFSTPQDLTCTSCSKGSANDPSLWINGQYIFVTWEQKIGKVFHAVIAISADGGMTFGNPIDLSSMNATTSIHNAHLTQVTSSGSDVYVTWADSTANQIWVASSTNDGSNWTVQLVDPGQSSAVSPLIASTGSHVYLVWTLGTGSKAVEFSVSNNYGALHSFSSPTNLALYNGVLYGSGKEADLTISGNNIYVVWDSVFFRASANDGATWPSAPKQLGTSAGREPLISSSGNYVYVVWTQKNSAGVYQININVNSNNGNPSNWLSRAQVISDGPGKAEEPQVAAAGSDVYVMYRDNVNRNGARSSSGIFFLYNTMNGAAGKWLNSTSIDTTYTCGAKVCGDLSQTLNNTSWGKMTAATGSPATVDLVWTVDCGLACGPLPSAQSPSVDAWNVVVAVSTDDGQTFSMQTVHPDNGQQGPIPAANAPPISASSSGGTTYVAYQDNSTQYSNNGNTHTLFTESPT